MSTPLPADNNRPAPTPLFQTNSGAFAFFLNIAVWGIGIGCFAAALNNFLAEIHSVSGFERGIIEFFRELPGFLLVFILALMSRVSDWKILRFGSFLSMCALIFLIIPSNIYIVTFLIMISSLGEHLVMPVRQSLAMQVASPGREGVSLGMMTSVMNGGTILGSLLVALVFWVGTHCFHCESHWTLFQWVWILACVLLAASVFFTFTKNAPNHPSKRPRLYFHRKFNKFYILELFYGARKQIFLTFAPYVLIKIYGLSTPQVAILMGASALLNMFGSPLVGRLADRLGYRTIMIWDTIILFWVCLAYGFADDIFQPSTAQKIISVNYHFPWLNPFITTIFSQSTALKIVCVNYLLDGLISTASLATNIYVREIAQDRNELTSTLSTGISINHLISILVAPTGGLIWVYFGVGWLFVFAAVMAVANSVFAWTLPKKEKAN